MNQRKRSRRKQNRKNHKLVVLLTSLGLLMTAGVAGTVMYLYTPVYDVTNTFTFGQVPPEVEEDFDGTVKKDVYFTNTGDVDAYIRAAIIVNWVDEDDNIYGGQAITKDDYIMTLNLNAGTDDDGYWKEQGNYYYWTEVVKPGQSTGILIDECRLSENANVPEGCTLSVDIVAQTIQTTPDQAIVESWGTEAAKIYGIEVSDSTN